jgi:hypothetical protein
MDFAGLLDDHRSQLGKALERFRAGDDDLERHLRHAARWIDRRWPRTVAAALTLTVDQGLYPAPEDCAGVLDHDWGRYTRRRPWETGGPGYPPALLYGADEDGPTLWVRPAPTLAQLHAWGAVLDYRYFAAHEISAERVTPGELRRGAVLLAALIEAVRDLATETAIVQLHKGLVGIPTAGTPAYLYERLIEEWER